MGRRKSLWGKIGKTATEPYVSFGRGEKKKVLMLPAVSCNPWKADGFLLVNQVRPPAPSPTMQPLACKSSLKFWQGMQLKWAVALLTGSVVCCWLMPNPFKASKCVGHEEDVWDVCFPLFVVAKSSANKYINHITWIYIALNLCLLSVGVTCKHLMNVLWLLFRGNQF